MEMYRNSMNHELIEKIQVCVGYDLIGDGKLVRYEDMNLVNQKRFTKQCTRLMEAFQISPHEQQYIHERYSDIMREISNKIP